MKLRNEMNTTSFIDGALPRKARQLFDAAATDMEVLRNEVTTTCKTLETKIIDLELFVEYACEVSPEVKAMIAGFKAKGRIGVK